MLHCPDGHAAAACDVAPDAPFRLRSRRREGSIRSVDPYCDSGTVAVTADHRRATANHRRYLLLASQFLLRRPYAMSQRCEAALALALPCGCLLNKHVMSCCVFVIVSLSLCSQGAPGSSQRIVPSLPEAISSSVFSKRPFCRIVCLPAYLFVGLSVTRHRLEYYWNLGAPLSPLPGCWWDWCAYRWKRFPDKG